MANINPLDFVFQFIDIKIASNRLKPQTIETIKTSLTANVVCKAFLNIQNERMMSKDDYFDTKLKKRRLFIVHLHGKCDSPPRRLLNFLQSFFRSGTNQLRLHQNMSTNYLYSVIKLIRRVCSVQSERPNSQFEVTPTLTR